MASPDSGRSAVANRVETIRDHIRRRRLTGFLVPRADEHQGEFVAERSERLAWLTGFTGSAGMAVVLEDRAALFVDGRYTLQAREQVDPALFEIRHLTDEPPAQWIGEHLPSGGRLGYDPWLHTPNQVVRLRAACQKSNGRLVICSRNPVDEAWFDRPAPPAAPMVAHGVEYAGVESAEKRRLVAEDLRAGGFDAALLSAPESVAWLLNVRGGDIPYMPVALCFALLHADGGVDLFIQPGKVGPELRAHLGEGVRINDMETFGPALGRLGVERRAVLVDGDGAPDWAWRRLKEAGARPRLGTDCCALRKARKNAVELDGIRNAHRRDGAAMARFLAWIADAAAKGGVTESLAADRLERERAADATYRGPSFATISGAGPNGAIVHYRVSAATDRPLEKNSLYLVDSGGQYPDGTTDITRTVAIGTPPEGAREHFTLVLQGHIALATARFPAGTTGSQLDALARKPLWDVGLDYDHGTGHGIGCYLGVHEGPQRISKHPNRVALEPGMVVSDEPGFYREGAYGIRIENLLAVVPDEADPMMLAFETLSLAPIDRTLIDAARLSATEREWVDAYHARVREALAPLVQGEVLAWLKQATAPL